MTSRNLIRIWFAKYEAGAFDEEAQAADLLQQYEAKISALERLIGRQALEIKFLKGAQRNVRPAGNARTSVLARPVGRPSPEDAGGDEPVRGERLQELRLAQRLLAGHGGSLLLFDEMEDLLADPFPAWGLFGPHSRMAFRNTGSKVYMHRLLEDAPTPTLWTMNSTRGVSETILRRVMFALDLRRPTPRVRARIWARELARRGIEAPSELEQVPRSLQLEAPALRRSMNGGTPLAGVP